MTKEELAEQAAAALRPFETGNLISTIQNLTLKQIFSHPAVVVAIVVFLVWGVVSRSKTILLSLFTLIGLVVLLRFAMPAPGEDLSFRSLLPFVGGGVAIAGVIIYVVLIKHD